MDSHFLLQGIFPTQGLNLDLPYCRQILYLLNHQGSQIQKAMCYLTPVIWHSEKGRLLETETDALPEAGDAREVDFKGAWGNF